MWRFCAQILTKAERISFSDIYIFEWEAIILMNSKLETLKIVSAFLSFVWADFMSLNPLSHLVLPIGRQSVV